MPDDESKQCRSLRRTMLHEEGEKSQVVYLRCKGKEGHVGKNHRSWMRAWTDSQEDGWIEEEYDDD